MASSHSWRVIEIGIVRRGLVVERHAEPFRDATERQVAGSDADVGLDVVGDIDARDRRAPRRRAPRPPRSPRSGRSGVNGRRPTRRTMCASPRRRRTSAPTRPTPRAAPTCVRGARTAAPSRLPTAARRLARTRAVTPRSRRENAPLMLGQVGDQQREQEEAEGGFGERDHHQPELARPHESQGEQRRPGELESDGRAGLAVERPEDRGVAHERQADPRDQEPQHADRGVGGEHSVAALERHRSRRHQMVRRTAAPRRPCV